MSEIGGTDDFALAYAFVKPHEGGLADDLRDPGGITNGGISLRSYPELGRDGIVALAEADIEAIYRCDFWLKCRIGRLPWPVSGKTFDLAVNLGPETAICALQKAVLACGQVITADGRIGEETIAAVQACSPDELHLALCKIVDDHYHAIVAHNPTLAYALSNWTRRAREWPKASLANAQA